MPLAKLLRLFAKFDAAGLGGRRGLGQGLHLGIAPANFVGDFRGTGLSLGRCYVFAFLRGVKHAFFVGEASEGGLGIVGEPLFAPGITGDLRKPGPESGGRLVGAVLFSLKIVSLDGKAVRPAVRTPVASVASRIHPMHITTLARASPS